MTPEHPPTPADLWPFVRLRARAGDLELRYLDDDLLYALASLAADGVHADEAMPFMVPWTRGTPVEVARSVLTHQWAIRSRLSPGSWALELAVLLGGEPVGIQAVTAADFPALRQVQTGSWLGLRHQGRGTGTRMRRLALHLAFQGLDAQVATTGAWADNAPSNGVTRRLGYAPNGSDRALREGVPTEHLRYRYERADWEANPAAHLDGVELEGLAPVRELLGIA